MIYLRTLLGKGNLDFSIHCLKSCLDNCEQQTTLEIFDDGTLTGEHRLYIIGIIPGAVVIYKNDRDEVLNRKLYAYPESTLFRNRNVFGYKLYDVMLYDPKPFFYIDSDIIFYRKFSFPQTANCPIFMMDAENAYCFSDKQIFELKDRIVPRINAGFYYFPVSLFKLDIIENILSRYFKPNMYGHSWAEQTLWGFLAAINQPACYFNNKKILMASPIIGLNKGLIAIHFSRPYRTKITSISQKLQNFNFSRQCLEINPIPAIKSISFLPYLIRKYRNKLLRKLTFNF